jgi:translocon-associated protein subunit alpha
VLFNGYAELYRFGAWPLYGLTTFTFYISVSCKLLSCDDCITPFIFIMFTGESTLNVVAVHSTLHLPFDHRMYGQNLTVQVREK